jgi:hypothetical protein
MDQRNDAKTTSTLKEDSNKTETSTNKTNTNRNNATDKYKVTDKINMDFDWNTDYGDGDIPNIDK